MRKIGYCLLSDIEENLKILCIKDNGFRMVQLSSACPQEVVFFGDEKLSKSTIKFLKSIGNEDVLKMLESEKYCLILSQGNETSIEIGI